MTRRDFIKYGGAGLAGATLLSSTACAGFTGAATVPPGTLLFSHGPDTSGTIAGLVAAFNKQSKDFQVEYREMPADTGQYFDKLRTEFQAGGGDIDVMSADVIWPPQFAANGWIEDLSNTPLAEDVEKSFLPSPIDACTYKGKLWAIPWYTDAGMLFYRKDLLEKSGIKEPPKTWDQLREMSATVQKDQGTKYAYVFQGAEYEGGVVDGCEYIWNSGGDILDPQDPSKVVIGNSQSIRGLTTERELVTEGLAPLAVATYKELESQTVFIQGDAVFMRNWPFVYGTILGGAAAGSEIKPGQAAVAPIPVGSEGDESFSGLGGWNFAVNAASTKKDQALQFIEFMVQPESQTESAIGASLLPPRKSLYEDEKLLKKQPVIELAKEIVTRTKPRPQHPFYSDMSLLMADQFNAMVKGAVSPQGAVDALQSDLQRIADVGARIFNL